MNSIPILYKYCSLDDAKKIIKSNKLKVTQPSNFNDPFDCIIPNIDYDFKHIQNHLINKIKKLAHGKDISKKELKIFQKELEVDFNKEFNHTLISEFIENIKKDWNKHIDYYKILCLSKVNNNILMWSHYANSHQGIVLGFDFNKENNFFNKIKPVQYDEDLKFTKSFFDKLFKELIDESFKEIGDDISSDIENKFALKFIYHLFEYFFIKNNDWSYEKEYRLVLKEYKDDFLPFQSTSLKSIIFGIKTSKEEQRSFIAQLNINNIQYFSFEEKNRTLELIELNV